MKFNSNLLSTEEQDTFNYNSSVRGSYSSMQFVIRLREDIRKQIDGDGDADAETSPEKYQAFSTYLHETIHWWQHIGSNFGFLLSTSYPSYATSSFGKLKSLIEKELVYKSLLKFEKQNYEKTGKAEIGDLNIIVNDYYDLENAKLFCLDNKNISDIIKDRRFFLSVGHSYMILWASSIQVFSEMFDKENRFLADMSKWIPEFQKLEKKRVEGFYPDSEYHISPLGIRAIYEGQAVFNQILYLKNIFKDNNIIFKDFIDNGMLHGIYLEAFDLFLQIINEERPVLVEDSLIGLFLLVCDIAINPNNGFPSDIYDYENFIVKNDPGIRFIKICQVINQKKGYFLNRCNELSKKTYVELSKILNKKIGCKCSYSTIKEVLNWENHESIIQLMKEEEKHDYDKANMPFRLFLAKYIKFQMDKHENPQFLCWIGYHIPNAKSTKVMELFEKHSALFIDSEDGEIKPILKKGIDNETLYNTFNSFYQNTILYELILKWISEEGDFKLDYKWLLSKRNEENIPRIKELFKLHFDIELDSIKVL